MREERRQQHLRAVGRDDDDRALREPRQDVDHRHARDDDAQHVARQLLGVAADERAVDRAEDAGHRGGDEEAVFRQRPHGHRGSRLGLGREDTADLGDRVVEPCRIDAVGRDGEELGPCVHDLDKGERGDLPHLFGRPRSRAAQLLRAARGLAAPEDEEEGRTEVRGDAGVVGELGRAADIRVVAAEDHDRVAARLDGLVALDDRAQRGLRIAVHVFVGDPDAVLVRELDTVMVEEEVEHVVALDGGAGDRAEHPDPGGRAAQGVEDAESDRGLPGVAFRGRDENAVRHGFSLGAAAPSRSPNRRRTVRISGEKKDPPRTRQSLVTLATFPSWGSWPGCRRAESFVESNARVGGTPRPVPSEWG